MANEPPPPPTVKTRDAPGLGVERSRAEEVRQALGAAGLLATDLTPLQTAGQVVFPLVPDAEGSTSLHRLLQRFPAAPVPTAAFRMRASNEADYRQRLKDLPRPLQEELPRAHDVIGDIAIMKLPDVLHGHRRAIAQALLATHPRLRTVALDRGVTGAQRVRDLEVLAGQGGLATTHREHGLRLSVEPDRVYFSPRLATERARLLERVHDGQRVLDLFAGIGAFVCLVARDRHPARVTAVDVNPHAIRLLERNLEQNKLASAPVTLIEGDAREVAPRTADWDHVVLNLPHDAHRFLDVAAACAAPDAEIHLYAILERDDEDAYVQDALRRLHEATGKGWSLVQRRHVRQYAPTMDGLGFTFAAS